MAAGSLIGSLRVTLGLDSSQFQEGLQRSTSSLAVWGKRAAVVAAGVAAAGAAAFAGFNRAVGNMGELAKQAEIAGLSAEEFKIAALAVEQYGISQEKLSDILKDVNDKFGDFAATGGGQLRDFFENIAPKVGLTIESFENLSSSDALALYVTALEEANVSQAEMTFYMEALANDATALVPAFRDGGAAINDFGERARELGLDIDDGLIASARAAKGELSLLTGVLGVQLDQAFLRLGPAISNLVKALSPLAGILADLIQFILDVTDAAGKFVREGILGMVDGFRDLVASATDMRARVTAEWDAMIAAAITWAQEIVAQVKAGLAGLYQAGVDAIAELGRGLRDSVGNLASEALTWGSNIAAGIRDGIKGGASRVTDAVGGLASSIRDRFRGDTEQRSPSRLFMRLGRFLTEGLAIGIESGSADAVGAMRGVADQTISVADELRDGLKGVFSSVIDGSKSVPEAIGDMLGKIADKLMNSGIDHILSALFGGFGRDPLSAALSAAIPGFANGVTNFSGGLARINERGGELVALPSGSTVIPHDLSKMAMQGGGVVRVIIEEAAGFAASVRTHAEGVAVETVRAYDRQVLPARVSQINDGPRRRG